MDWDIQVWQQAEILEILTKDKGATREENRKVFFFYKNWARKSRTLIKQSTNFGIDEEKNNKYMDEKTTKKLGMWQILKNIFGRSGMKKKKEWQRPQYKERDNVNSVQSSLTNKRTKNSRKKGGTQISKRRRKRYTKLE